MIKKNKISIALSRLLLASTFAAGSAYAADITKPTVEELRISKAVQAMPEIATRLDDRVNKFAKQLSQARNLTALTQLVIRHGKAIWRESVLSFNNKNDYDDRSLYWSRLKMTKALRTSAAFNKLLPMQQQKLMWQFELFSRGQQDVKFDKNADKKILVTGFDPFFLDRNITQSNPSGVAALSLDDLVISKDNMNAEIESLIVPVRFADFDQGMIEELLTPYFKRNDIDMIVTISMGRENFDIERFPGLRRSAKAPDNLNVYTGANNKNPLIPKLGDGPLKGPEFIEFSLPAAQMTLVQTPYKVNDNHQVTTLEQTFSPKSLAELNGQISVQGAGGGYLSNEISYRSLVLRDLYRPILPVGHIHTPRIKTFSPKTNQDIVGQIKAMLTQSIPAI